MKITLSGNPISTNSIYHPVCVNGHPRMYMSKEGQALKEQYAWEAKSQWRRPVFDGEMCVEILLYFPDKRRHDIDNYSKILLDSLTSIVWRDDSQIVRATVEKRIDKLKPRIEIFIS